MKKLIILCVMAVCSVCSAELSSNTVTHLSKTRIGRTILLENLKQKRLEILGLASRKEALPTDEKPKFLVGAPKRRMTIKGPSLDGWEYTVTTNDQGQITKIAQRGTLTVMMIWNDFIVPMRYRTKFVSMTDEERTILCGYLEDPWTERDPVDPYLNPKKVEEKATDSTVTEEIRETQTRGW